MWPRDLWPSDLWPRVCFFNTGTKEDEDKLRKLFSENGPLSNFYEVDEQQRNLLMEDFKSYLQKLKVMLQTGQYHSFLLFILSHGSKVGVALIDI